MALIRAPRCGAGCQPAAGGQPASCAGKQPARSLPSCPTRRLHLCAMWMNLTAVAGSGTLVRRSCALRFGHAGGHFDPAYVLGIAEAATIAIGGHDLHASTPDLLHYAQGRSEEHTSELQSLRH